MCVRINMWWVFLLLVMCKPFTLNIASCNVNSIKKALLGKLHLTSLINYQPILFSSRRLGLIVFRIKGKLRKSGFRGHLFGQLGKSLMMGLEFCLTVLLWKSRLRLKFGREGVCCWMFGVKGFP